ncbi:thioesterase family protein [Nocardia gamkensis]|uniref:thioesterase family protein n=1 Tax=Nocardia gamkensis TaxID=352869 RepID=UPI0037CA471D
MASALPTLDQVMMLPDPVEGVVTGDFIDMNGHMNVVHYLDWGSRGADALVRVAGIDNGYRSQRRMGLFTAEHHLAYYRELRMGDKFSVHARVLDRSDKTVHMMTFLVDQSAGRLSNTLEILLVHVDLDHRRAMALPDDIAVALDHHITDSENLGWAAPTCGAIRIRH